MKGPTPYSIPIVVERKKPKKIENGFHHADYVGCDEFHREDYTGCENSFGHVRLRQSSLVLLTRVLIDAFSFLFLPSN